MFSANSGPHVKQKIKPYLSSAASHRAGGQVFLAIADCNKALQLDPQNKLAYLERARCYYDLDNPLRLADAITDYFKVLQLDPHNKEAYAKCREAYAKRANYYHKDDPRQAIVYYSQLLELDPDNKGARFMRASWYHKVACFKQAIDDYTTILNADPTNLVARLERACCYYAFGTSDDYNPDHMLGDDHKKYDLPINKAIEDYDVLLKLDPKNIVYYEERARCYHRLGSHFDLTQAIANYTSLLQIDPKNVAAHYQRARCYHRLGKPADLNNAIADYTLLLQLEANKADIYVNRGNMYLQLKKYDKARRDFDRAIAANPSDWRGHYGIGLSYHREGNNPDFVIKRFTSALEINSNLWSAYYYRGIAHDKKGEYKFAISDYGDAIKCKDVDERLSEEMQQRVSKLRILLTENEIQAAKPRPKVFAASSGFTLYDPKYTQHKRPSDELELPNYALAMHNTL